MPRKRFLKLEPNARRDILVGAAREFASLGFNRASLNAILKAVGLSKGAMYYYFDSKEDLYEAVIEYGRDLYSAHWIPPKLADVTAENYWSLLADLSERNLEFTLQHPWVMDLYRMVIGHIDDTAVGRRTLKAFRGWVAAYLAHGQALGTVRDDVPVSLLVGCVMGLGDGLDRWFLSNMEAAEQMTAITPLSIDLFRRLLEPRPETPAPWHPQHKP